MAITLERRVRKLMKAYENVMKWLDFSIIVPFSAVVAMLSIISINYNN